MKVGQISGGRMRWNFKDYFSIVHSVLHQWKESRDRSRENGRNPRPRATSVPTRYSSSRIKFVRQNACKQAGVVSCGCWGEWDDCSAEDTTSKAVAKVVFAARNDMLELYKREPFGYPCENCVSPGVSMSKLSEAIFGVSSSGGALLKSERTFRKWLSGEAAMSSQDYGVLIAQAAGHGWLSLSQAANEILLLVQLRAVGKVLIKWKNKEYALEKIAEEHIDDYLELKMDAEVSRLVEELVVKGNMRIANFERLHPKEKSEDTSHPMPQNNHINLSKAFY